MTCDLRAIFLLVACLQVATMTVAGPLQAEYSVRWDRAQGGPQSAKEAWAKLNMPAADADEDAFRIRYPAVSTPSGLPPGFKAIVRERQKSNNKKFELTFKQRGASALPASPSLADWTCPVGADHERKDEVDISFVGLADSRRAVSRSCTVESKSSPPDIPPSLGTQPKECWSKMTRLKAGKLTIEQWQVPDGRTVIEVSRSGDDTQLDRNAFRDQVVKALVKVHKIKPLDVGMTELGSACGH